LAAKEDIAVASLETGQKRAGGAVSFFREVTS